MAVSADLAVLSLIGARRKVSEFRLILYAKERGSNESAGLSPSSYVREYSERFRR